MGFFHVKKCAEAQRRLKNTALRVWPHVPPPKGLVNRRKSGRPPPARLQLLVDSSPGRAPLQHWRKLTFLFRSSNNLAFKMLLTLHNTTDGALHTRLRGGASKLWPVRGWMEMSSPLRALTGFFFFGGGALQAPFTYISFSSAPRLTGGECKNSPEWES